MLTPAHVELYCRMQADPAYRAGYRVDAAVAFCEQVEHRLARLSTAEQETVVLQAIGYTQAEMAERSGCSLRTMQRRVEQTNAAAYGEWMGWRGVWHPRGTRTGVLQGRKRRRR